MTALEQALNKLCKWRSVFAGWQLGTRPSTDPECQAVRDHREVTMLLRTEMNALTALLIEKGVIKQEDFQDQLLIDAELLDKQYEERFPGFKTSHDGVDIDVQKAAQTMKGWRP